MNKRGLNHIEIMLSFLIFIGFVVFALYFFSPFQTSKLVETSIDYAFREIIKNTTTEIDTYSVKMDLTGQSGQLRIKDEDLGIDIGTKNLIFKNNTGSLIDSSIQSGTGGPSIKWIVFDSTSVINSMDPTNSIAIFLLNEEFPVGTINGGTQLSRDKITILSSDKEKYLSEKKFLALNNSYYANYQGVKEHFNFPSRANFEFTLKFDSNDLIETKRNIPEGVEIYTDTQRVEVFRIDRTTKFADLIVKVW